MTTQQKHPCITDLVRSLIDRGWMLSQVEELLGSITAPSDVMDLDTAQTIRRLIAEEFAAELRTKQQGGQA